jgi:type II secretory pathway pseudopilin PulG
MGQENPAIKFPDKTICFTFKNSSVFSMAKRPSLLHNSRGFTYLALLAAIIIGISMGAAGMYWQNVVQREKEEELLFRGDQYRLAIERYYSAVPGRVQYPASIDDLLKDVRIPTGKRYLRRKYKDP